MTPQPQAPPDTPDTPPAVEDTAASRVYQTEYARASVLTQNEVTAAEFASVDDDLPTSAILSPEEIAEDLNENKVDEDGEEKTENDEEEERPVISNTQALKMAESLRHFLTMRSNSGAMIDKLSSIELFIRQSTVREMTQTSLDAFFKPPSV